MGHRHTDTRLDWFRQVYLRRESLLGSREILFQNINLKSVSLGGLNSLPSPHTPTIPQGSECQGHSSSGSHLGQSLWVTRMVAGVAAQAGSEAGWQRVSAPCPSCSLSPAQRMLRQQEPLKQAGSVQQQMVPIYYIACV